MHVAKDSCSISKGDNPKPVELIKSLENSLHCCESIAHPHSIEEVGHSF